MKKLLTLLVLLCMVCTGAKAAYVLGENKTYNQLSANMKIALKCCSNTNTGYLYFGTSNVTSKAQFDDDCVFVLVATATSGKYYLKNVSTSKYIQEGNNGASCALTTSTSNAAQFTINQVTNSNFNNDAAFTETLPVVTRFIQNNTYLNCQALGGSAKYATGQGAWSFFKVFAVNEVTTINVTYKYMYNGTEQKRVSVPCVVGEVFPQATSSVPYGISATWPTGTVTSGDGGREIEVNCELSSANEIPWANSFEEVQWKAMKMRGGYMYSDSEGSASDTYKSYSYLNYKNFEWGFIGNPFSFKIVNRGIGEGQYLTHNGNTVTYNNTGDTFQTTASTHSNKTNGKFVIEDTTASSQTTLHSTNSGHSYALWVWTSGSAIGDEGSQVSIKDPDVDLLNQVKSTAIADMPEYEAEINALTSCDAISEYVVPVTYTLKGYWSEDEIIDLGSVTVNRPRGSQAINVVIPGLAYYSPDRVTESISTVDSDHNTFTLYCVPNFPFTVGQPTRIHSARTEDARKGDWYDDNGTPMYYVSGATMTANTNLWVLEHVANTQDQFTVKNYATGKYLTFKSKGRQIGSLVAEPVNNDAETSYMRVRPSTYNDKPAGGFILMHANNSTACMGPHIDESNGVGGWDGGSSAQSNNTNCLEVLTPETFTATLAATDDTGRYGSIYLPYSMTLPEDVEAYTATRDGVALKLAKVGEAGAVLPDGAYILYSTFAESAALALGAEATVSAENNDLTGKFQTGVPLPAGNNFVLNEKDGVVGFYKYSQTKTTYPVAKAVLCAGESSVSAFRFDFTTEQPTGIESLIEEMKQQGEVFDLQGRRLSKLQKGMNIINGRKVLR